MPRNLGSTPLSAPFAHRELNGEGLLEELAELQSSRVADRRILECALVLKQLATDSPAHATARMRDLAKRRFTAEPALSDLVVRWAVKVKTVEDLQQLIGHFERLALVAAMVSAIRRGGGVGGGGG